MSTTAELTVTVTVFDCVPPGPGHVSVKLVVANKGTVTSEPLVARDPLHPPLATHPVEFVDNQASVEFAPASILVGFAESEIVGEGGGGTVTAIVTALTAVPPGPEHVSEKLVVATRDAVDSEPLIGRAPLQPPLAMHAVALVDDQVSVELAPARMLAGLADSTTVGRGVGAGPVDTTRFTADPVATLVPADGFWLATLPAGTVALDCCVTVPTTRPSFVITVVAAACVRLTTFGTVTIVGGAVTVTVTVRDASPPTPEHVSV